MISWIRPWHGLCLFCYMYVSGPGIVLCMCVPEPAIVFCCAYILIVRFNTWHCVDCVLQYQAVCCCVLLCYIYMLQGVVLCYCVLLCYIYMLQGVVLCYCVLLYYIYVSGPGLVFIVYPEAIGQMTGSTVWSILFFFMMILLGFSSEVHT